MGLKVSLYAHRVYSRIRIRPRIRTGISADVDSEAVRRLTSLNLIG